MDNQQQSYNKSKKYVPGMHLGTITIIEQVEKQKFLVKCENCGRIFTITMSSLAGYKKEPPTHCKQCKGAPKSRNHFPGEIFGNCYELIEFLGGNDWKVRCTKCGKEQIQSISNMKKHKTDKCFYCDNPNYIVNPKRVGKVHMSNIEDRMYSYYKGHVLSHNKTGKFKEFLLTQQEYSNLIHQNCYYCGQEPSADNQWNKSNKRQFDPTIVKINGIDRIDSNKGYTIDNCVPCCPQCNRMKLDYTTEQFLSKVKQIYYKMFNDQSEDVAPSGCEMEDSSNCEITG